MYDEEQIVLNFLNLSFTTELQYDHEIKITSTAKLFLRALK